MLRPLLPLGLLLASLAPLAAADSAPALAGLTYSGDQASAEALDRDLAAAGTDPVRLARLESQWLGLLRRTDLTFAARQAVAQRLGSVLALSGAGADAAAYRPLGAMLLDEREAELARLALDQAPGDTLDRLLTAALPRSAGRARLGILDTLARRRTAAAVPAILPLLDEPEAAAAAARALGAIASDAAVAALQARPEPAAAALTAAKLAAAPRLPAAAALPLLRAIEQGAREPAHRLAAFRLSLDLDPAGATARLTAALGGQDWDLKQVALESIRGSSAPGLVPALTAGLPGWDAPTQGAVLHALARRGETTALPAILAATAHADAAVRADALTALGLLPGTPAVAARLAVLAAGADADDARLARQSLTRLGGAGIDAAIVAGASQGPAQLRAVHLEMLGARHQVENLPLLLQARTEADAAVRAGALSSLGQLGTASEVPALLAWTIAATDATEQDRALRALVTVILRGPEGPERGQPVHAAILSAPPATALRLLPALGRIGGTASADCAAALALRSDAKLAEEAVKALGRWTDASGLAALATVAEKAALPAVKASALELATRSLERSRDAWQPARTKVVAQLLPAAPAAGKAALVTVLARANDRDALALAEQAATEAALRDDANYAATAIRAALAGAPKARAHPANGAGNLLDGKTTSQWSAPSLGEEWIEVDFRARRGFRRITLDQTSRTGEYPAKYEVRISDQPDASGQPVATGTGETGRTVINLPAGTQGRYLHIRQTAERKDTPWTISELYVD